ncbi:MAG TPA: hypothetical protein VGZ00_12250 [Candidatus Baltobacteraceae bacterium]|nr:hypothetical protein [Candidatus Baltobacteraceae bacterium]
MSQFLDTATLQPRINLAVLRATFGPDNIINKFPSDDSSVEVSNSEIVFSSERHAKLFVEEAGDRIAKLWNNDYPDDRKDGSAFLFVTNTGRVGISGSIHAEGGSPYPYHAFKSHADSFLKLYNQIAELTPSDIRRKIDARAARKEAEDQKTFEWLLLQHHIGVASSPHRAQKIARKLDRLLYREFTDRGGKILLETLPSGERTALCCASDVSVNITTFMNVNSLKIARAVIAESSPAQKILLEEGLIQAEPTLAEPSLLSTPSSPPASSSTTHPSLTRRASRKV